MGLTVDADIDPETNLLGKVVTDLQADVEIEDDTISGTLAYVDDFTGFSGDPALQEGNYLVLHAEVPDVDDVTIKVTLTETKPLDADGIILARITDKDSQTLTVVASKEGCEPVTKVFTLTGLTLETE